MAADPAVDLLEHELRKVLERADRLQQAITVLKGGGLPAVNGPPSNGSKPKLRQLVINVFRANPTRDLSLVDVATELGRPKNSIRHILYALRDEGVLVAVRGAKRWDTTTYHLAPPGYRPPREAQVVSGATLPMGDRS